jgi:polyferredoxin
MQRTLAITLAAGVAFGLFVGLTYAVLVAAHVSEPAASTVYGFTARRLWATTVVLLGLVGAVTGGRAFIRSRRQSSPTSASPAAFTALVAGAIAAVNGGLVVAVATGGPGTGNGVVGGAAALVLGVAALALGGATMARSRRAELLPPS